MIVPFNTHGLWYQEIKIGDGWRVQVHNGGGPGNATFFDSAVYTQEEAHALALYQNAKIHMT